MSLVLIALLVSAQLPALDSASLASAFEMRERQIQSWEAQAEVTTFLQKPSWPSKRMDKSARFESLRYASDRLLLNAELAIYNVETPNAPPRSSGVPLQCAVNGEWVGSLTVDGAGRWNAGIDFSDDSTMGNKMLHYRADWPLWLVSGQLWNDSENLQAKVKGAQALEVRPTEEVGGAPCYVLHATCAEGEYVLWLDPEKGFAPRRVQGKVHTQPGTAFVDVGHAWEFAVDDMTLTEVDGVWVPTEGTMELIMGESEVRWVHEAKLSDVRINEPYSEEDFMFRFPENVDISDVGSPTPFMLRQLPDGRFAPGAPIRREEEREIAAQLTNAVLAWSEPSPVEIAVPAAVAIVNEPVTDLPAETWSPKVIALAAAAFVLVLGALLAWKRHGRGSRLSH